MAIPGHGTAAIEKATIYGGPSLLVRTVQQLTGVPVNHFSRVDFVRLVNLVDSVGGVDVTVPKAFTSYGHRFAAGVNHLAGVTLLYYARDPAISEQTRLLRQQNLLRAAINKIVKTRLLTNPISTINLLNALTSALTVDSNFSNSQLVCAGVELQERRQQQRYVPHRTDEGRQRQGGAEQRPQRAAMVRGQKRLAHRLRQAAPVDGDAHHGAVMA